MFNLCNNYENIILLRTFFKIVFYDHLHYHF